MKQFLYFFLFFVFFLIKICRISSPCNTVCVGKFYSVTRQTVAFIFVSRSHKHVLRQSLVAQKKGSRYANSFCWWIRICIFHTADSLSCQLHSSEIFIVVSIVRVVFYWVLRWFVRHQATIHIHTPCQRSPRKQILSLIFCWSRRSLVSSVLAY